MNIAMVAADIAKWIAFGECRVRAIHGWNNQGADVYIQLHEVSQGTVAASTVQPANGTVPTYKSLLAQQSNGFDYRDLDVDFRELVVCCSSTETALTIVGAAGGLDMTIEVDGPYLVANYPTLTVVGDLTNNGQVVQIWAEAAGPNTLVRHDVKKVSGSAAYVVGYAVDSPASTSRVLFATKLGDSSTVIHKNSGQGTEPLAQQNADFSLHQGLTLQVQTVPTAIATEGLNAKVRAMYI